MNVPVTDRADFRAPAAACATTRPPQDWRLPHEEEPEEPYRPELVARLERALRLGRYRPEARAIADALLTRIDSLE